MAVAIHFAVVVFHRDHFRPPLFSRRISFNWTEPCSNQFQPQLASSLFHYVFRKDDFFSEQRAVPSWAMIRLDFRSSSGFVDTSRQGSFKLA
jgi:hypothetical protein